MPGGRPSEIEAVWQEVATDGNGGKYIITSQGTRVYGFRYVRKTDGKIFKFEEDPDAADENVRRWK